MKGVSSLALTKVPSSLLRDLGAIVGRENVLHRQVDLQTYEYDAYVERSVPRAVVYVHSTAEVSAVVKLLARERIPFVPRGYGTNVSGGTLALDGGVVLEMSRMNRMLEIDLPNQRVVVQPGIFNLDVSTLLSPFGYYYAPDPASQKASSLGGNIAENASGPHCFKYGVTSNYVLGLELVLPDGEVMWTGGKSLDLPGLDLTGVFVGSEGTMGIATAAILRILKKPETVKTMLGVFASVEDAGNVVSAIVAAGVIPATLEMMDGFTVNAVEDAMACGFPREAGAVLMIELDGLSDGMEDMAQQIVAICRANGALDVRVAGMRLSARRCGGAAGVLLGRSRAWPPATYPWTARCPGPSCPRPCAEWPRSGTSYGFEISCVLHAGDGNLHPLALFDDRDETRRKNAEAASMDILRMCVELGGTVSGEHGIGIEKLEAMQFVFDDNELRAQALVKDAFDPEGLSNPGKVLPGIGTDPRSATGV